MKLGILADAHGNPLGLAACLQALMKMDVTQLYFLGDAVGYFSDERGVLELLRSNGVACQKGNHEAMLLGDLPVPPGREKLYRLSAARKRLSPENFNWIGTWPDHRVIRAGRRNILLVHGSPTDYLTGYVYPDSDLSVFDPMEFDGFFCGHSHRPFIASRGAKLVANAGSCGMPRDAGDLPSFMVYDSDRDQAEVFRVRLDVGKVEEHLGPGGADGEIYQRLRRASPSPAFGTVLN